MYRCPPVDCTIPDNYTVAFDADPDIDGIGVIASFYIAAWVTLILLAIVYFTSAPDEFDNFGFSILDVRVVKSTQSFIELCVSKLRRRPFRMRAGARTGDAFQKAILLLSDQQLITGAAMSIVGLARLCQITQYHFNTVMNLALAASAAHSMTFSFVSTYIKQNVFFRTWRAIAMIVFGGLLVGIWTVTGSNDWLTVYGLPALCGFENLGQGFGAPASVSLFILYWFLVRGWAYAITILFPGTVKGESVLLILSSSFWMAKICDLLQKALKMSAGQLEQRQEILHQVGEVLEHSHESSFTKRKRMLRQSISRVFWSFLCGIHLFLFIIFYAAAQVWASFAFSLCWSCYTFVGSARIVAYYRTSATDNGMSGSENQWSFGQQLPVLMLLLPAFAMAEFFFDDVEDKDFDSLSMTFAAETSTQITAINQQAHLYSSDSFGSTTSIDDLTQSIHMLRRRVDTKERLGMDIVDVPLQPLPTVSEETTSTRDTVTTPKETKQKKTKKPRFLVLEQVKFAQNDELRDRLWSSIFFKIWVFLNFLGLSFIMNWYGI